MGLYNKIEQKQVQKLSISNKLVQSLKILNMGRVELEEQIEFEQVSNPLLEVEVKEDTVDWEAYFKKSKEDFINFDKNEAHYKDNDDYDFENMTVDEDSLFDSLHGQISIMKISKKEKEICDYMIDSLDKDGYMREDEGEIARKFSASSEDISKCISIIQTLEPSGIGARNLSECIIIQLHGLGVKDQVLESIISEDINLIANSNVKAISTKYQVSVDKVKEYIRLIKTLDPRPAEQYIKENIVYSYPDVVVDKVDGRYVALPYNEEKIKLGINTYYSGLLLNSDDPELKKYIKEKLNSAKKLINDIGDRNSTIVNIANVIIDMQYDFFDKDMPLRPMNMNDVAEKVGCHVSTVSRGVNDKYMLTKKGLLEFKTFFSTYHEKESGEATSTSEIMSVIKEIIDSEDKKKPLSDKKIEDILKERGYEIARRTVAKYREELGFLSSSKRKQI